MAVAFTEALPPALHEAIAELEAHLGVSLPEDYRRFLARQNGGYLDDNFFPPGDASARYLYSAGANDHPHIRDLESEFHSFYLPNIDLDYRLRTGFLPIGEDEGGNRVCLKVAGEDYGAVWFWTHDTALDEDPFERLSDGFSDFFEALRPIEELDVG